MPQGRPECETKQRTYAPKCTESAHDLRIYADLPFE